MAGSPLLEQPPEVVDLLQIRDPQLGDEVAAPREVADLTLLLEHAQRLTNRRDADSQRLGHLLLGNPLPGPQLTSDDRAAQGVERMLAGRARAGRGRDHLNAWMPVRAPPMTSACTSAVPS